MSENKIENVGKYYLYRHIRMDNGTPFYVGIGTVREKHTKSKLNYYSRAFNKKERNNFWKRVVAKTDYEVEILLESNDYEFIEQKEIEFIALYGRRDLNKGTLVNLTDGGGGTSTIVFSDAVKELRRLHYKQGRTGLINKNGGENTRAIKVVEISTGKIFETCKEAADSIGMRLSNFCDILRTPTRENTTGFKYLDESSNKERKYSDTAVYDYNTGNIIKSISKASKLYNIGYMSLSGRLKGTLNNDTSLIFYRDFLKGLKPNNLYTSKQKAFKVINIKTGEIFKSMYAAYKTSGLDKSTFKRKVQNKVKNDTSYMLLEEYNSLITTNRHIGI